MAPRVLFTLLALLLVSDADAQGRRPQVSEDLASQLRSGVAADATVIITGTQARIDRLAARHGLVVRKRLQSGAVLDVPGERLTGLANDAESGQVASNHRVGAQSDDITLVSTGADQLHDGVAGLGVVRGQGVGVAVID